MFLKFTKRLFGKILSLIEKNISIRYLGSSYGGWYILNNYLSDNLIVISAGAGEDISFDIEMLNSFQCKVFIIDPTPRAVQHIEYVKQNLGKGKSLEYDQKTGKQPIEAYDLTTIKISDFKFIEKALYNESKTKIKFYKPLNKNFVSHSISNYKNDYKTDSDFIEVSTITLREIMVENKIKNIDILKLDIEGAENKVLPYIIRNKIFPKQILVEFDEINSTYITPYLKALYIVFLLVINKYKLVKTDKFPNFLFVRL